MTLKLTAAALALAVGFIAAPNLAQARMVDPGLKAPSSVEQVACRTVRERVRRPGGRVIWKTRQVCTPGIARRPHCVMERQRIVRPGGHVTFKQVRRCR